MRCNIARSSLVIWVLVAAGLVGCVEDTACGEVGCVFPSYVTVDVLAANGANNQAALSGSLEFVAADATVTTVALSCGSSEVLCTRNDLVVVRAPFEAAELRFAVLGSDGTEARGTVALTWGSDYPNGRDCGPECREALLTVRLQ